MTSGGIGEEEARKISEFLIPYIASEEESQGAVTLGKVRYNFKETGPRLLRQGIIHGLKNERLYRTRVIKNGERKPALTTKRPPDKIMNEMNRLGEESEEERFSRKYTCSIGEKIKAPETSYGYNTLSGFPKLFAQHMKRHKDIDSWNKDMISDEEKVHASWRVTDSDYETVEGERELSYEVKLEEEEIDFSAEITLKKRKDCLWSVDPLSAEGYLRAALGLYEDTRFRVLEERANKGEEVAELAADLMTEEEGYSFEDWRKNFEDYRDFLIDGREPEKYFDKEKEERGIPLTCDPFINELDGFVDDMKGEETKSAIRKDSGEAENMKGAMDEFLEYVEDATYGRIKSGRKQ